MPTYRLYVDESGTHGYGKPAVIKEMPNGRSLLGLHYPYLEYPDFRFFGLTGVIFDQVYYRQVAQPAIENLKSVHFEFDRDMDPLILHRKDIISRAGHFGVLKESLREAKFNSSLLSLLSELNYTIITVVIDKKKHLLKYRNQAYHPYHYCLCAMLERYTGWLRYFGQIGDVMAEARGKKEDEALADAYRRFHREGTDWMDSSVFQKHLTSKEVKLKKKEDDINGLQLADLLAHPTKQRTLLEYDAISEIAPGTFGTEVLKVVESKFNRNFRTGAIRGYGMVYL